MFERYFEYALMFTVFLCLALAGHAIIDLL